MSLRPKLAEIIHEKSYDEKADLLEGNPPRLTDVMAAIEWSLARDPKQGTELEPGYRVYKTTSIYKTPAFWVLYKYEEASHKVFLMSLEAVKKVAEL